jgi:membrane protein DedA with SNARE-associated domain
VHTVTHIFLHTSPLLMYLLVGCVLLLESSGVPILNSTLLLFAGALVSLGHLNIVNLALASIVGSVAGACLAYYIGGHGGQQVLLRLASLFHVDTEKIAIVERWFQHSGAWMIFFSRMLPYARPFACFPAGIAQMNFLRFFCAAFAGSTIWCISMLVVGWNLGKRWELAVAAIQQYTLPVLGLIILLLVLYIFFARQVKRYLQARFQRSSDSNERSHDLVAARRGFSKDQ